MEITYDKAALLEYMDRIGAVGERMHRRQDESLNALNSCRQKYSRIHTKLEEAVHRAYNRLEQAESNLREAELEYELARCEEDRAKNDDELGIALGRVQLAHIRLSQAQAERQRADEEYRKAQGDLRNLETLWVTHAPALESQARALEGGLVTFSRVAASGNSDLNEYMGVMDQAQAALYGTHGGEAADTGNGILPSRNGDGTEDLRQTAARARTAEPSSFRSRLGNTVGILAAVNGLKHISMNIGGAAHTFPDSKSGAAKAYRTAVKSGDKELADYAQRLFAGGELRQETAAGQTAGNISLETADFFGAVPGGSENSRELAGAMAAAGLVRRADFGGLDYRTAQDIYRSVAETLEIFPDIDLKFVGSVQSRNRHLEKSLENMYLNAYRQHYPGASDAQLMPFVREQVETDMKGMEPGQGTIAQSLFVEAPQTEDQWILADYNGISINEQYGADYSFFADVRRRDVEARWKPVGCDTPRATVDHELGHQIARLTDAHNDDRIRELYARFMGLSMEQRGEVLSGYAGESIHEFIAEGWSEYRNNPNCRSAASFIAGRLLELYQQNTASLVKRRR